MVTPPGRGTFAQNAGFVKEAVQAVGMGNKTRIMAKFGTLFAFLDLRTGLIPISAGYQKNVPAFIAETRIQENQVNGRHQKI